MKASICLFIVLSLCGHADVGFADRKYGFIAASDEELLQKAGEMEAVVLGCVYQDVRAGIGYDLHVTVIDSYRGPLKTGDKIFIAIVAEGGPPPEDELGRLHFFFLTKNDHIVPSVAGSFWCEWTDNLLYEKYGEPLRKLLREKTK